MCGHWLEEEWGIRRDEFQKREQSRVMYKRWRKALKAALDTELKEDPKTMSKYYLVETRLSRPDIENSNCQNFQR